MLFVTVVNHILEEDARHSILKKIYIVTVKEGQKEQPGVLLIHSQNRSYGCSFSVGSLFRLKRHYNPNQQLGSSGQLNQGPCKRCQVRIPHDAICFKFKHPPEYQLVGYGSPSTGATHRFHAPQFGSCRMGPNDW
ncbi:hypothetical protein VNO77_15480 [Canavalia gladiata]|uniref:Uncharacterized protein n=1 Tax=Canavalia gladiata TaxID=3824 RepID=A0AAN9QRE3_CANGL